MDRKKLTEAELEVIAENPDLEEESWSESGGNSDNYEPSSTDESISDNETRSKQERTKGKNKNIQIIQSESDSENKKKLK